MSPLRRHDVRLRPATRDEIKAVWDDRWHGVVVGLNTNYTPADVEGLALVDHLDDVVGLVTYHVDWTSGQIVTLDTIVRGRGFGRRLLEDVENKFHKLGLKRAWALMTNDNLRAAGLYLSRGYRLVRIHLDEVVGLATYHVDGASGQIVTLDTLVRGRGFGRRLLEDVESKFHKLGLGRAWALMTNDNLRAAGLYLSRGYRLVRVHLGAVDQVREHKPHLPERGYEGIPIRDLWEFEKIGPLGVPVP